MEFITQPWPWFVGGPLIALILFLMFYFGKSFGVSTTLETFCSVGGAGKFSNHFKIDVKQNRWRFIFVLGIIIGGFLSSEFLMSSQVIDLNPDTVKELADLGFANAGSSYLPEEIFSIENLLSLKGLLILIVAGILIGFGSRYAGGCTSGHAITGLSSLQMPSLLAVIGFFIGGLIMTWFLIPLIF
jgi:uncharacterized membrane protein YedE/YeeE